jgi:penicillin-insensitive murein endopeptidase
LLGYAAHIGVAPSLQTRAALTMVQPHGSLPHDDHFHVRISCPPDMKGCIENPAYRIARRTKPKKHSQWKPAPAPAPDPMPKPAPKTREDDVDEALPAVLGAPLDIIDGT